MTKMEKILFLKILNRSPRQRGRSTPNFVPKVCSRTFFMIVCSLCLVSLVNFEGLKCGALVLSPEVDGVTYGVTATAVASDNGHDRHHHNNGGGGSGKGPESEARISFDSSKAEDLVSVSASASASSVNSRVLVETASRSHSDKFEKYKGSTCPQGPVITILEGKGRSATLPTNKHGHNQVVNQGQGLGQSGTGGKVLVEDDHGNVFPVSYDPNARLISLSFSCWADEPISWDYQGVLATKIESTRLSRSAADARNASTFCYNVVINVTIQRSRFTGTGNYTCAKIGPEKASKDHNHNHTHSHSPRISSIYLYGSEKNGPYLLRPTSTVSVFLATKTEREENNVLLTLPCLVNNPMIRPSLLKENSKGEFEATENSTFWLNKYKTEYNPKIGFEISKAAGNSEDEQVVISRLEGRFKCQVKESPQDLLLVNVTKPAGALKEGLPHRSTDLQITVRDFGSCISFHCNHNSSLSSVEKLEIAFIPCENPIHCHLLVSTSIREKMDFSKRISSSSISGQHHRDNGNNDEDLCTPENEIPASGVSMEAHLDVDADKAGIVVCRTRDRQLFQTLQVFPPIPAELEVEVEPSSSSSSSSSGSGEQQETHQESPHKNRAKLVSYVDWEKQLEAGAETMDDFNSSPVLHLGLANRTFYVNEAIELTCTASAFVFAQGVSWLIQLKNGTIVLPTVEIQQSDTDGGSRKGIFVTSEVRINMTSADISGVICAAPLWNSTGWQRSLKNIRVVDGTKPTIVKVSETDIFFYDTDVNKSLVCEAHGVPAPEMLWYKGDLPFVDETQNSWPHNNKERENVSISSLHFKAISSKSFTVAGVYVCNATNSKGTALKSFRVAVGSSSTWKVWMGCIAVIFICLVAVLTFYLQKFYRKSATQEEYIRQLSANEIEEFKYGRKQNLLLKNASMRGIGGGMAGDGRELALYLPYDDEQYEVNEHDLILEEDPVNRKLGEGNYGVVVKGTLFQRPSGTSIPVAVKMLKSWRTVQAKALLSELKILTYVGKHPNVVSLVGAITNIEQTKIQVIIEYCAHGSLETYLRQKRGVFLNEIDGDTISFTPTSITTGGFSSDYVKIDYAIKTIDLISWAYQFACGMEYLASRKIIHGDLAARNLLLTETRDLKITDFGLSKKLANYTENYIPIDRPAVEQKGQPWRSLAIEYWLGNKKFSTQSDVWAYGVTLWEIFSLAQVPYPEFPCYSIDFVNELAAGYRMEKPNYANSRIYEIMKRCWQESPSKRPSFTLLADWFLNMLPGNYASSIGSQASREPSSPFPQPSTLNLEYIYADELEQFQFQDVQDC